MNQLRKWSPIAGIIAILAMLFGAPVPAQASSVSGKTFTIGTDVTYAPFEFKQGDDYVGIDMDLIRKIAEKQGFKVDIKPLGFDAAVQALESGQVDAVIAGMTITDARKEKFDFSDPYFESGIVMGVKNDSDVTSYEQLRGKKVAVKTGTAGADFAESIKGQYGFTTTTFNDSADMVNDVKTGNSQALVEDYPVVAYMETQNSGIKMLGEKQLPKPYGFAVKKGQNAPLLASFNDGLKQFKSDGTYNEIVGKYLGASAKVASEDAKTYTIGTDVTYAPFEFKNDAGEYVGIDMDLIRNIAKEQNFKVDIKPLGFDAAVQALESGQVDGVIAGMTITDARKEKFDFSEPYFESGIVMGVKDDSELKSYDDLKGKKVAVKTGTAGAEFAESIKDQYGFTTTTFNDSADMVNDVKTGNSDALVEDFPVVAYIEKQGAGLKMLGEKQEPKPYGFAVKKGQNQELLSKFNEGLAKFKDNGEYDKIVGTYLATDAAKSDNSLWGLTKQYFPYLLQGLGMTLLLTAVSLLIALILGMVFGLFRVSNSAVLRGIGLAYVDIFRGTPLIVQAFFIYFGIPAALGFTMPAILAGIITLSLNAGAYMAEIIRGGIQSVDKGQMEAGRSLGLSYGTTMKRVVIPQAIRTMTPSFVNQFVITLKDTSILSVIGIAELTQSGKIVIAQNFESFKIWLIVAIMYFVIIMALTKLSTQLEKRNNRHV